MKRGTIAVDFDGVIHAYSKGWSDGSLYDNPNKDAGHELKRLVQKGFTIIIFTTRVNHQMGRDPQKEKEKIKAWMEKNGMKKGTHYHDITSQKPAATVYIDDRALRFTNWKDIGKYF